MFVYISDEDSEGTLSLAIGHSGMLATSTATYPIPLVVCPADVRVHIAFLR